MLGGGLSVENGAVLTLAPCTVLKFGPGQHMHVSGEGSLQAIGEPGKPITFTSTRRAPAAGDWGGIIIEGSASNDVTFQHVILEYAAKGLDVWNKANVNLSSVSVRQSSESPISVEEGATLIHFDEIAVEDVPTCMDLSVALVGQIGSFSCTRAKDATLGIGRGTVTEPAKWKNWGIPYRFLTHPYIHALVEIDAGVEIQVDPLIGIGVNDGGALRALGTKEAHVVFQSSKPAPSDADWRGLSFDESSSANSLLRWTGCS